jgi:FtsZ-binding cell division protein ZapB
MTEPLFWLGLSIFFVAISLTALLITAIPAFQEITRAARAVVKLADTLSRELPPTLESIRLTGLEISELSEELNQGAKGASEAVQQVNQGLKTVQQQAQGVTLSTKTTFAGIKAGWEAFRHPRRHRQIQKSDHTKN